MKLTFEDALRIANGCTDYGGGYRSNREHYEIYQHGIQTVIAALTAASKTGLDDTQTRALHSMGANCGVNPRRSERTKSRATTKRFRVERLVRPHGRENEMATDSWKVVAQGWLTYRVERRVFANFAGSGYQYGRKNGRIQTFWRRSSAQAFADQLNAA